MSNLGIRRLMRLGVLGLPALGIGCSELPYADRSPSSPMTMLPHSPVDHAMGLSPAMPSSGSSVRLASATSQPTDQPLSISLDTVLRLAEQQNPQVAIARAKVGSACAEKRLAATWMPDIYAGFGYYRHDGGIQDQTGKLIISDANALDAGLQISGELNLRERAFKQVDAARKVWQSQGELSKITYEQLLDASTTYIDFLAACSALAISMDLEIKIKPYYDNALRAYNMNMTADVIIEKNRIDSELKYQQRVQKELRGKIEALSAKLCYLLGLDPHTQLVPYDSQMVALNLVDTHQPTDSLVSQALSNGPGVREMEGILCVINSGVATAKGASRWAPIIGVQAGEGFFGAGPSGVLDSANRFDLGLQAKWNISDLFTGQKKHDLAMNQICQANLAYQDLRSKLTLSVHEAKSTIDSIEGAFPISEELIKEMNVIVDKVKLVLDKGSKPMSADGMQPGSGQSGGLQVTNSDVVTALHKVMDAQLDYVAMMREYDKAQLRLMVVLGVGAQSRCETVK
jgi:outer membrane protein TolC